MKLNQSVSIGDMVVIKGQKKGYPIASINSVRTKLLIGGFLGDFEVSQLKFIDNESPCYSDEEVKAIEAAVAFAWQDVSDLQIALDDIGLGHHRIVILSSLWCFLPEEEGDFTSADHQINEYLMTYNSAVEEYVIENELYK